MSAKVIELSQFRKNEEEDEGSGYQALRDLMVSLFGPLEHVPEEAPAFEELESEIV